MDKFFRIVGGRKFLLTVASMLGASAIDLLVPTGLSAPLAGFLGAALTAFCATNWLNSREFHKADAAKKAGGTPELARLEKKVDKLVKALDNNADSEYYINTLENINQSLGSLMQSQATVMQSTDSTNKLIKAAMQSGAQR